MTGEVDVLTEERNTLAVDECEGPRYESTEERKRAAVEFFKQIGHR